MGFFDNAGKQHKLELVELQNIVLNINEKKLQVSEDFLDKMTKIYISKHMKVINAQAADLAKLSSIGLLFKKYDLIMSNLEELIKIENLYTFKKPAPSEYKVMVEDSMDEYINSLIAREWKKIKSASKEDDPDAEMRYNLFFDSFVPYSHRLPAGARVTLNRMKDSVFPDSSIKEDKLSLSSNAAEEEASDGFVEEVFETIQTAAAENADSEPEEIAAAEAPPSE
ncbi:MAG: hypothetical protein NC120_12775 [Ruminococcus sp.]|nr:hypothetical protein [Ruminococcus sp.]